MDEVWLEFEEFLASVVPKAEVHQSFKESKGRHTRQGKEPVLLPRAFIL